MNLQNMLGAAAAAAGSLITFMFGGWSESLTVLMLAMAIDYITGVLAAIKEDKGLSSSVGYWGLTRKGVVLLVIMLAHRVDILLGTGNATMGGAIYFYLANELISVTENYGRLGLPLPDRIKQLIEVLKGREGNN
ncbi:phage holin family protein [Paenibacillus tarimensis]|uniref:phage holin family protein n=1 Tax=Paenibacillus tarimensis TaxID=416012 RepID=UPI001F27514F|nr:phage holin family protein [Paenibacillus tarimensis]MCF2943182.1 phage holin family protein [Paenibacillus tarimensis]